MDSSIIFVFLHSVMVYWELYSRCFLNYACTVTGGRELFLRNLKEPAF